MIVLISVNSRVNFTPVVKYLLENFMWFYSNLLIDITLFQFEYIEYDHISIWIYRVWSYIRVFTVTY